jgi:tRNA G26 N,N-dimethylase Trm1
VDAALRCVRHGGCLYTNCTDGLALCGKNPPRALASYGARVAPNAPGCNETALRVLVGDAARRGAAQGLRVTPVGVAVRVGCVSLCMMLIGQPCIVNQ